MKYTKGFKGSIIRRVEESFPRNGNKQSKQPWQRVLIVISCRMPPSA
ncbi:MAG: hypothetical protein WC239_03260 [Sphaerochaetaceae bacterium]